MRILLAALLLALLPLAVIQARTGSPADAAVAARPNVVVIMTDDQTVADLQAMPRTRRVLGREGVTFAENVVSFPLCCPSRATLNTGRYAHNHGVLGNRPPLGGYGRLDQEHTLPVWLSRAGYATHHIGKYLNGYGRDVPADVPPGWTDWKGSIDGSTYLMWGYTLNENGKLTTYGDPKVEDPALYQTDVYRQKAVEVIRAEAGDDKPFYLDLAFLAPHAEAAKPRGATRATPSVRPAPRHKGAFKDLPLPRGKAFNEADVSDKPEFLRDAPRLQPAQIRRMTRNFRARREALLAVDEAVEAVVGALRETGQLESTYIMFTADNGFFHGEHRIPNGKLFVYEPSSNVPLIVRGPGIPAGRVSREPTVNVDLAATILDVTGAKADRSVDGRSLVPFARAPARRSSRPLLHEVFVGTSSGDNDQDGDGTATGRRPTIARYSAIRTARWLWVEYTGGDRELYDLAADPAQLRSRHADARYARTRRVLAAQLADLRRCAGASCRRAAPAAPRPRPATRG